jgi:sugar phosphate isomerase/epimerase
MLAMKIAVVTTTPEISIEIPVSLFSGSFDERVRKAVEFGFDGIELLVLDPGKIDAGNLIRTVRELGLEVAAVGTGAQLFAEGLSLIAQDTNTEHVAFSRFMKLIEFTALCQSPLITLGSFRGHLSWGGQDSRSRLSDMLGEAANFAEKQGVKIAIEPLNRYENDFILNTNEGISFIREMNHRNLGLLLDTFHMNIEEADIAESTRISAPHLFHVHIGDSNRLPPGQGHFRFAEMIGILRDIGYRGYLSAELLARPDPDTAAKQTATGMGMFLRESHRKAE